MLGNVSGGGGELSFILLGVWLRRVGVLSKDGAHFSASLPSRVTRQCFHIPSLLSRSLFLRGRESTKHCRRRPEWLVGVVCCMPVVAMVE